MANPPSAVRVRVLRLDASESALLLCLSDGVGGQKDRVGGLFGHYAKGGWVPCKGTECPTAMHATKRFWRGYLAAEHWQRKEKCWVPVVLEVSESLELDMRGRYQRGQVWEVSRSSKQGKKKPPYVGRLHEQRRSEEVPNCFAITSIVEQMYHALDLDLSQPSDQPDRVYLAPREGKAPRGEVVESNGNVVTVEQRDRLKSLMNGIGAVKGGDL